MKRLTPNSLRIVPPALGLIFALFTNHAGAAFTTWDPQGANPQNPYTGSLTGTWESTSWDTTDQLGTSSLSPWVESTTAIFAVNSGTGTPAFTVTMNSSHTVAGIYDGGQTPGPCPVTINGTGTITLPSGNQTFSVVSPGTLAISNVIAGSGALVRSGSGTLTLYGVNTYSGGTTIGAGGTLTIAGAGKLGNGTYSAAINNTGTFNYNSSASQTLSGVMSGAGGALAVNGSGTLTLTKANTYGGGTTIGSGAKLTLGSGGTLAGSGAILNNGTFNYNNTNSLTLSGPISGSGSLSVNPSTALGSQLTLSGANSYTGPTTIALAGQVIIANDSGLGTPPAVFTANQLVMNYGFLKASGTFTLNANRGITFGNAVAGLGGSIQVNPGFTLTIASPMTGPNGFISGSGEANFGYGTNLLTANSTYTGATGISTGRLMLGVNGALPTGTPLIMAPDDAGGPFFDLGGYTQTIGPLSTTNSFSGQSTGTGIPTIVLNGALTILQTNTATVFGGYITGSGSLTINGNSSGTLALSFYPNDYTGGTIINGGTLEISVGASISGNVTVNGGTLQLDNSVNLSSAANLTLGASAAVFLNNSGVQTVGALYFGSTPQATGYWGAVGNGSATYTDARFTGPGLILVCPAPQTITPASSPICAGSTTTASVPVTAGATYSWSVNNGTIISGGNSSTVTYSAWAVTPVTLNCIVTSPCGAQSPGGQNVNVPVNICGLVVEATNAVYNASSGTTMTGTGVMGATWYLNASPNANAPLPWPTIQSGTVTSSPFTISDPDAINHTQRFYYLTNSDTP